MTPQAFVDEVVKVESHLAPILELGLPAWGPRTFEEQVEWLRAKWTQQRLRDLMNRAFLVLDLIEPSAVEYDLLLEELDPIGGAIVYVD